MAKDNLQGLKVAILATDGFEQVELLEPRRALDEAGAETRVVSPKKDRIRGWNCTDWGGEVKVDVPLERARPEDFDALYAAYDRCMGQFNLDKKGQVANGQAGVQPVKEEVDKALKACESKNPLPPWEKDVNNPDALDFATRVVQCLRDKGVRYVEVHNEPGADAVSYAFGGPNNDAASITLGLEHAKECEIASSKK